MTWKKIGKKTERKRQIGSEVKRKKKNSEWEIKKNNDNFIEQNKEQKKTKTTQDKMNRDMSI